MGILRPRQRNLKKGKNNHTRENFIENLGNDIFIHANYERISSDLWSEEEIYLQFTTVRIFKKPQNPSSKWN